MGRAIGTAIWLFGWALGRSRREPLGEPQRGGCRIQCKACPTLVRRTAARGRIPEPEEGRNLGIKSALYSCKEGVTQHVPNAAMEERLSWEALEQWLEPLQNAQAACPRAPLPARARSFVKYTCFKTAASNAHATHRAAHSHQAGGVAQRPSSPPLRASTRGASSGCAPPNPRTRRRRRAASPPRPDRPPRPGKPARRRPRRGSRARCPPADA